MASLRRLRRRSCENKVTHVAEIKAAAHARSLGSSWYRCRFCGKWHVGRPSRKQQAANRAAHRARFEAERGLA